MPEDDHNETVDNLTIENSITDPGGDTHTDGLGEAVAVTDDGDAVTDNVRTLDAGDGLRASAGSSATTLDAVGTAPTIIAADTVVLENGSAVVDTGVASGRIDVSVDPSGNGIATQDVSVRTAVRWDESAGAYAVEFTEESTSVGDPLVAYTILQYPAPSSVRVDSFERASPLDAYSNETDRFAVVDTHATHGSHALVNDYAGVSDIYSEPGDGLPAYPQAGDTIRYDCLFDGTADGYAGFQFGFVVNEGAYQVRPRPQNDTFQLWYFPSGESGEWLASTDVTYDPDVWYTPELEWQTGGGITARLYDDTGAQVGNTISTGDDRRTDGGLGWNFDGPAVADNLRIDR